MSILSSIEEHIKNAEAEVAAWWQEIWNKAASDKQQAIASMQAEVAKGDAALQSAWAKLKAHL